MTVKHTPGPWVAEPQTKAFTVYDLRGSAVARVGGSSYGIPHEQRQADATLIAASPELYAALSFAAIVLGQIPLSSDVGGYVHVALDKARTALSRAEGRS